MQKKTSALLPIFIILALTGSGCAGVPPVGNSTAPAKSFAVLALSRGSGVPKTARGVLNQVQNLLDKAKKNGADIVISRFRIGVEGETKLCAEFSDPLLGGRLLAQIRELSRNVDLINVAAESCGATP